MSRRSEREFEYEGVTWTVRTDAWQAGVSPPPIEIRPCIRFHNGRATLFLSFESSRHVPSEEDLQSMSAHELGVLLERALLGIEGNFPLKP